MQDLSKLERSFVSVVSQYVSVSIDESYLHFWKHTDKANFNSVIVKLKESLNAKPIEFEKVYEATLECLQVLKTLGDRDPIGNSTVIEVRQKLSEAFKAYQQATRHEIKRLNQKVSAVSAEKEAALSTVTARDATIAEKNAQISTLESDKTHAAETNALLAKQKEELISRIKSYEAKLSEHEEAIKKLQATNAEHLQKIETLKRNIDMHQALLQATRSELDRSKGGDEWLRKIAESANVYEKILRSVDELLIPMDLRSSVSFINMEPAEALNALGCLKRALGAQFEKDMRDYCEEYTRRKALLEQMKRQLAGSNVQLLGDVNGNGFHSNNSPAKLMEKVGAFNGMLLPPNGANEAIVVSPNVRPREELPADNDQTPDGSDRRVRPKLGGNGEAE